MERHRTKWHALRRLLLIFALGGALLGPIAATGVAPSATGSTHSFSIPPADANPDIVKAVISAEAQDTEGLHKKRIDDQSTPHVFAILGSTGAPALVDLFPDLDLAPGRYVVAQPRAPPASSS